MRTLAECCGNCEHHEEHPVVNGNRQVCTKCVDRYEDVDLLEVCENFSWGD